MVGYKSFSRPYLAKEISFSNFLTTFILFIAYSFLNSKHSRSRTCMICLYSNQRPKRLIILAAPLTALAAPPTAPPARPLAALTAPPNDFPTVLMNLVICGSDFFCLLNEIGIGSGKIFDSGIRHKLRKREDWTERRIFLSLLIDHMMTKYVIVI
jgi:hypothetical protein